MELVAASRLMTSRQPRCWLPGVSRTNMGQNIKEKGLLCDQMSASSPLYIPEERSDTIMLKKDWVCRRGDIYYADLNPVCGSEQGGKRPVLVIQNDKGNTHSPTLIVATITTKLNKKSNYFPTHYIIRENPAITEPSVIMLEQIRTIDKERVIEYLGKISQRDMTGIDRALMTSLSLNSENTVIKYILKD